MRQRFLRISGYRRSAVHLAWALASCCHAASLLPLLLRWDQDRGWRGVQLFIVGTQTVLALHLAFAKHESPAIEFSSFGNLAPLATYSAGRGFLRSEVLRLAFYATLSWYPLEPVDEHTCHIPKVNILMQQAVITACTAIVGVPAKKSLLSLLLLPLYCFLDWRYASLNAIPGAATLLQYLGRRGALMLLSKLFFTGIPALIMLRSSAAQDMAVYGFCLPLLAVQCFASGMRLFHGVDSVGLWEVWVATVVAFGIGTDVGHVVEELRVQFSKVRMIADDILPHHVVDTLMQQQRLAEDAEQLPDRCREQQQLEMQAPGALDALLVPRPLARTSSATSFARLPLSALPPLRSTASMSHAAHAAGAAPEPRQLRGADSQASAGDGAGAGGGSVKSRSCSAELPLVPMLTPRRVPTRRTSALLCSDEAEYAEEHPGACILFADVCGFTTISEGTSPGIIVNMLNKLFSKFDEIISESCFLYKLDVIGDCYMVASGLRWHAGDPRPARTITDFAKLMLMTAATVMDPVTQHPLNMRCGIHQGPVVGALVGSVRRKYSLFGDAVNAASRLESTSRPGAIHVSAAIYQQLWRPCLRPHGAPAPEERPAHELRCVEEGAGQGQVQSLFRARGSGGGPSKARVSDSARLTGSGGAGGGASKWGSVRMWMRGAVDEAEGAALAGMGLLAIGSEVAEEAAAPKDSCGVLPLPGEQERPAGTQAGPAAQAQAERDAGLLAPPALDTMVSSAGGGACSSGDPQRRSPPADGRGRGGGGGGGGAAADPGWMGEEAWAYRGQIDLKGRAALETYLLQVIQPTDDHGQQ